MNTHVHQKILQAAKAYPQQEALCYADQKLTYAELDTASNSIASIIKSFNPKTEQCIGLFMGKSIEAIMAIYGILRANSVYVPLDTKNPINRIQHIVNECDISIYITTPEYVDKLNTILTETGRIAEVIILTDHSPSQEHTNLGCTMLAPLSNAALLNHEHVSDIQLDGNSLAAILYTSGSSGVPKGVMITHDSIITFIDWVRVCFSLSPDDRCASHAPLHFDLSLLDIFANHSAGATVILIPDAMAGNPKLLTRLISEQNISIWQSVPSVLVLMLKYGDIGSYSYPKLRHVMFAGEKMDVTNLRNIAGHFTSAKLHNIYGCTETNDTFIYSMPANNKSFPDPLPIGKPLPYVDFKIINKDGVVDNGPLMAGELLVSTPTLMRGYRNSSEDKIIKFEEPGNDTKPGLYYKTGDLVEVLDDGTLKFSGRIDDIIKTNGYRVNLLEVENILQTHAEIRDVAVISVEDDEIGNKINAIIATAYSDSISIIELKMYCAKHLPKYAIPHIFEISSAPLPKTSSGKINKRSLINSRSNHVTQAKPETVHH